MHALELTVATEVTNAALQVESTLRRMEAARAARELQEKRLENEQSKFEVGMSTNFFVVQAQRDLLDAQITELRATLDYQKALVTFERVQQTAGGV
jgi:outer membrane protein TolC